MLVWSAMAARLKLHRPRSYPVEAEIIHSISQTIEGWLAPGNADLSAGLGERPLFASCDRSCSEYWSVVVVPGLLVSIECLPVCTIG
jgi:hypothetical protein